MVGVLAEGEDVVGQGAVALGGQGTGIGESDVHAFAVGQEVGVVLPQVVRDALARSLSGLEQVGRLLERKFSACLSGSPPVVQSCFSTVLLLLELRLRRTVGFFFVFQLLEVHCLRFLLSEGPGVDLFRL